MSTLSNLETKKKNLESALKDLNSRLKTIDDVLKTVDGCSDNIAAVNGAADKLTTHSASGIKGVKNIDIQNERIIDKKERSTYYGYLADVRGYLNKEKTSTNDKITSTNKEIRKVEKEIKEEKDRIKAEIAKGASVSK